MTDDDDKKLPSLEELDKSIREAKKRAEDGEGGGQNPGGAYKVSVDLLAGVVVGSFIGYHIDKWLGTLPVFFIICFFLGIAGSVLNIYRSIQQDNKKDS